MTYLAEVIVEELQNAGVDRVFGLPGGEVLFLMEALRKQGIAFTLCRHEANAGIAAAVYGKLKRVPGVVLTTLGPGAANLMLPLSNSLLDREPLLAISAQIPGSWPSTHTHQRLPLHESYRPVVKYAAELDSYSTRRTVRQAIRTCMEEPVGPVYLTLSAEDAMKASWEPVASQRSTDPASEGLMDWQGPGLIGDPIGVAEELRLRMAKADRPLVILGMGVSPNHAEKLRQWLHAWSLPVAVTPKVKGLVDETLDNFVGVIGGMAIDALMVEMLHSADLLIGFGFDPVEVDKTWHSRLPILWVLESPQALQVVPFENLLSASHGALLDCLLETGPPRQWDDPFVEYKRQRCLHRDGAGQEDGNLHTNPVAIVRTLAEVLPPDTIVTTDVGSHKYIFGQFWPSRLPETFFMSNGLSAMGYGLSAAIGAKLARPNVPVLAALGDGGFSMNSQELETARRVGAPVIAIVLADRSYSLIHLSQKSKGLPNHGVDFDPIDAVGVARACGVEGVRVESSTELGACVAEAMRSARSLVVEIPLDLNAYQGLV